MTDEVKQSLTVLIGVIVANWVTIAPILKWTITTAWKKSIEWRDMQVRIDKLEELVARHERDLKAAHDKLRAKI